MSLISGKTKIFGIIGSPIKHSFSPMIHNFLFEKFNLDSIYIPLEVSQDNLKEFIRGIKAVKNFIGLNVTVPFKNQISDMIDELKVSPPLKPIPVNTVKIVKNKIYGYNTDIYGFKMALKKNFPEFCLRGKNVLLLGAGGAAQAVAISLLESQVGKLVIVNRTIKRAEQLKSYLKKRYKTSSIFAEKLTYNIPDKLNGDFHLIVNATSIGLKNEKSIISFDKITNGIVYDLIYNPAMTDFLTQAKKKGLKILNGLDMLIFQAFQAFQIWTGKKPNTYYAEVLKKIMHR